MSPGAIEPHMPEVDVPADLDAVFAGARKQTATADRPVALLTPGRMLMLIPSPPQGSMGAEAIAQSRAVLGGDQPLAISVVAYTKLEDLVPGGPPDLEQINRCIPFVGHLLGFAYVGHSVVIFEGHPTAFEAGVRGADVLMVDEAMLAFLQPDWVRLAFQVMRPGGRIFLHQRFPYGLLQIVKPRIEPDGEASYANCLLAAMANARHRSARLAEGEGLLNLSEIACTPPDRTWAANLPFRYDQLDAGKVMDELLGRAKPEGLFRKALVLRAQVQSPRGVTPFAFELRPSKQADGRRQLEVLLK